MIFSVYVKFTFINGYISMGWWFYLLLISQMFAQVLQHILVLDLSDNPSLQIPSQL